MSYYFNPNLIFIEPVIQSLTKKKQKRMENVVDLFKSKSDENDLAYIKSNCMQFGLY